MPSARLTLPSDPGAVAVARRWAVDRCRQELGDDGPGWDAVPLDVLDEVLDVVELLTSEVVANAVVHGAPPVRLEVECGPDHVTVAVHDGCAEPPHLRARDLESTGGRGVALVDVMADEWGSRPAPEGTGKVTWFRCGFAAAQVT